MRWPSMCSCKILALLPFVFVFLLVAGSIIPWLAVRKTRAIFAHCFTFSRGVGIHFVSASTYAPS